MSPLTNEGTPNMSTPLFSSCSTPTPTSLRFASSFLPRRPLRKAHDFFLDAIRERFIDDLCNDNTCLRRMCNGVLLGFPEHQSVWGDGWDHHDKLRYTWLFTYWRKSTDKFLCKGLWFFVKLKLPFSPVQFYYSRISDLLNCYLPLL